MACDTLRRLISGDATAKPESYTCDAAGSDPSTVVTLLVHDLNGNRIAEHDGAGAVIREYLWLDGRPLAVVEGGQTYQLHWDHILRPVLATDATGAVVWAASYLPFGGIGQVHVDTLALAQNLRFPGQWFQAETGLHQNWMRDYDPTTGRYLEADPLGLVDGPSVYGYARQSPVRYTDPTGEFIPLLACLGGAATGALAANAGYSLASLPRIKRAQEGPRDEFQEFGCKFEEGLIDQMIAGAISGCIMVVTGGAGLPVFLSTLAANFAAGAAHGAVQGIR